MKLATLVVTVLVGVATAAACHHDNPPPAVPQTPAPAPTPAPTTAPPPAPVTQDTQVSPGIAMSSDIAELCGIKPTTESTFDYDKDELTKPDRDILSQLATCMTSGKLKGKSVALIGRADPRGT